MSWKRVDMAAEAVRRGTAAALKASFETAFTQAGAPRNAALFELTDPTGVHFYFSPGAAVLFEATLRPPALPSATPKPGRRERPADDHA
jgi:hypothetical protein